MEYSTQDIKNLNTLGMNTAWLKAGILNCQELSDCIQRFKSSDDKCTEHYRHGIFGRFIDSLKEVDKITIESVLTLKDLHTGDSHFDLTQNRIMSLVESAFITTELIIHIEKLLPPTMTAAKAKCLEILLIRDIRGSSLTEELFDRILLSKKDFIQRLVLSEGNLTNRVLTVLSTEGCNKRIRNIAVVEIKRRQRMNPKDFV